MSRKIFALVILGVILASGCTQIQDNPGDGQQESLEDAAKDLCIRLCMSRSFVAGEAESGPCLSDDNAGWTIDDWVCDVAHSPRQAVDNEPANQCQAYREGRASHFVELDPQCNLIRAV